MKTFQKIIAPLFLLIELCLYIIILFFPDLIPKPDYIGIALAYFFAACFIKPKLPNILLQIGLLATLCADTFLVLLTPLNYTKQTLGVAFFSVTQLCYFAYIFMTEQRKRIQTAHLFTRLGVTPCVMIVAFLILKDNADLLSLLSVFYVCNLAINAIFAFLQGKKGVLLAIGLTLFLCCDLFVGFSVAIGSYLQVPETSLLYKIVFADFNFIWFFYLPSQVVISCVAARNYRKELLS